MQDLVTSLNERRQRKLYRTRQTLEGSQDVVIHVDGREYLSFCSNDYLGLAAHPRLITAFKEGADRFGVGSGAAHLITGHSYAHQALEEELADFVERPRALLFSTGYMANLGVVSALAGRGDVVLEDRLNHASLIDAARLSGAQLVRYRHSDMNSLRRKLSPIETGACLIASDGVFSMDGDRAPLRELASAAEQGGSWLLVDDAHGFGVLGPDGRGWFFDQLAHAGDEAILMATLGKAFGTFGAFVAGSEALIETLVQHARTFVYTTAPPPAVAWATRTALQMVREGHDLRDNLHASIVRFRQGAEQLGIPLMPSDTPIQPVIVGDAGAALRLSEALRERGILVTAIRPPTVPEGTARLRITLSARHAPQQVDRLLAELNVSFSEILDVAR
ncbi:MAG: 8-amino-7-oxononanoate synthase [Thiogranum sp.]|nr:8-amino-7-oxononanoate synthase [Thiogranum sp.]